MVTITRASRRAYGQHLRLPPEWPHWIENNDIEHYPEKLYLTSVNDVIFMVGFVGKEANLYAWYPGKYWWEVLTQDQGPLSGVSLDQDPSIYLMEGAL